MSEDPLRAQTLAKVVRDASVLSATLDSVRGKRRTVLVKGVYDLFHSGHYYSFVNARSLGDLLIVAVNDDDSVSKRKGEGRPILALEERVILIAALSCVDYVTVYYGASPFEVISTIRPNIFAASHFDSLTEAQRAELEQYASLHVVPKLGGSSTTAIIAKIRSTQHA